MNFSERVQEIVTYNLECDESLNVLTEQQKQPVERLKYGNGCRTIESYTGGPCVGVDGLGDACVDTSAAETE
jgi:hypothetical protein